MKHIKFSFWRSKHKTVSDDIESIQKQLASRRSVRSTKRNGRVSTLGCDDSQQDADAVLSDEWVQEELDRHPVNPERLFWVVRRISHFEINSARKNQFVWLFGRYR